MWDTLKMLYLDGVPIKITKFPDNTSQVWQLDKNLLVKRQEAVIRWKFEDEGEFIHLAQLKTLVEKSIDRIILYMDYLPYARQDKEVSNESTFGLSTFANILNSLNFTRVEAYDPHSTLPNHIINNFVQWSPTAEIQDTIRILSPDVLCYPDAGAKSKYNFSIPSVYGVKHREPLTGFIKNYSLIGDVKDKSVLIIDDICDGGATFVQLAHLMKDAKEINLHVSHGLFTNGTGILNKAGIQRIFTKNGEI